MKISLFSCLLLAVLAVPVVCAADSVGSKPEPATVEMFAAMQAGDIEVKLIPKDSTTGMVTIKNKTGKPLTIKLPEAFAGVPVLAQFGGGGGFGQQGGQQGGGGNQGIGGGGLGGGGFGGGQQGGGGLFNVGPEKVGKLKFVAVCLEHGKKDPNPNVPYEIRPIESFTDKPEVVEVVKMLGRGEINQTAAQAAAWNLANGLSWQELAAKVGHKHLDGRTEPYFALNTIQAAQVIAHEAERRGAAAEKPSAGKSDSLSKE